MVFNWRLSDSKSPQISRTLLCILAVFNNAVVWMVSTRPPTSKSPRPFNNPLVTVPNAPITIGIIVSFMFHSFFNSIARLIIILLFWEFFLSAFFFFWSLSNSKSPQVSRTLISILADHNNTVWIVSTRLFISTTSSPCNNPFVTVPSEPITIDTLFFQFSSKV